MPRIHVDPALEEQPDFSSDVFQGLRTLIIGANQTTEEEAAEHLAQAWRADHDNRIARWQEQREDDARIAAEEDQARREQEEQERIQQELLAENERQEAEKKKPKMNDFDEDQQ
ncbi:hypothetical protein BV22DRAFT_1131405, partial [Leucogyrophana mollusca]